MGVRAVILQFLLYGVYQRNAEEPPYPIVFDVIVAGKVVDTYDDPGAGADRLVAERAQR